MKQYINKAAIVAEIKERIDRDNERAASYSSNSEHDYLYRVKESVYKDLLSFINNLEVKKVDLEKELENLIEKEKAFVTDNREVKYCNGDSFNHIYELEFIAKHFFELGLKTKGE